MEQTVHISNPLAGVQTARRALDLLLLVVSSAEPVGLTELARRSAVNKATTYRLAALLEEYGYIAREPGGRRYIPGAGLVGFAAVIFGRLDIAQVMQPVANRVAELTGETTSVHIPRNLDRVCIGGAESQHLVRRTVSLGHVAPLLQGVTGRVLLAYLGRDHIEAVTEARGLSQDAVSDLTRELADIRAAGYCIAVEPRDGGMVGALAVPILRADGIAAALTVAGPADRFNRAAIEAVLADVLREAEVLSAQLGYKPRLGDVGSAAGHGGE